MMNRYSKGRLGQKAKSKRQVKKEKGKREKTALTVAFLLLPFYFFKDWSRGEAVRVEGRCLGLEAFQTFAIRFA